MTLNHKQQPIYKKHIYWLTEAEEIRLREELASCHIKVRSAKGIVPYMGRNTGD